MWDVPLLLVKVLTDSLKAYFYDAILPSCSCEPRRVPGTCVHALHRAMASALRLQHRVCLNRSALCLFWGCCATVLRKCNGLLNNIGLAHICAPLVQDEHRGALQAAIISAVRARERGDEKRLKNPCLGVGFAPKMQSLLGFSFGETRTFLQLYFAMPSLVPKVKKMIVAYV